MEENTAIKAPVNPASPTQVLMVAAVKIPGFVIEVVNGLLAEAMTKTSPGEMRLLISKSTLESRLIEAARAQGIALTDGMWKKFPYLYADKWDVLAPYYGANQRPHYVFSPKGVRRMQPEDVY